MMKELPLLRIVEWLHGNEVRLFFSTGRIVEVQLPVRSAKKAKIVDYGMGVDPGNGRDLSASYLYRLSGKVMRRGSGLRRV